MPTDAIDTARAVSGVSDGKRPVFCRARRSVAVALCVLLLCLPLAGCAESNTPQRYTQVFFDVFDTVTTVIVYDESERSATARIEELHALLQAYHKLYDIYNTYEGMNNLCSVNQSAGIAPVAVDARILDLVEYAVDMDALTGGKMNIAMGAVLSIWKSYRDAGTQDPQNAALPPMEALCAANAHADIGDIVLDRAAGTLYLADADMRLDVGSIAKGYAAQKATEAMRAAGVTSMLLSVGGNVCSIGTRPNGAAWKVGIQDPYSDGTLCAVQVDGQSVVTSGTYERYYTVDGVRYHHIIDPDTLMPAVRYDSVTVISGDSALADALTTGLFCLTADDGMALVESLPDTEAFWVLADGSQRMSAGFVDYLVAD